MAPAAYQIVIIAPGRKSLAGKLRNILRRGATTLGLAPGVLRFFDERSMSTADPSFPICGVYFGGGKATMDAEAAIVRLRANDVSMLPVVPALKNFTAHVPSPLHPLNGYELRSDAEMDGVANHVLQQLGLVRRERMAFISYKRSETRRAALQIYHALDARSWGVFLDTHSIEPGAEFQSELWDKMANADVLLFLDSPGAISSRWVQEELARAHDIGMGVLQLVWPTQARTPGTEFCDPEYLDSVDFVGSLSRAGGARLRELALRRITSSLERVRAQALAARRNRLVREFCASASSVGQPFVVQPGGEVELRTTRRAYCMVPVVGHPRSEHLHDLFERAKTRREHLMVLYDAAGARARRLEHMRWLNRHLPIQTLPVHESFAWLRTA